MVYGTVLSCLGETDSWKKPEVENLVALSYDDCKWTIKEKQILQKVISVFAKPT